MKAYLAVLTTCLAPCSLIASCASSNENQGAASIGGASTGGKSGTGASGGNANTGGRSSLPPGACTVTVNSTISATIPSVAVVTFATSLQAVDSARVEYGLDTAYGMVAPVDLAQPNYRTPLLGMKPGRTYHFRVVTESGTTECVSSDYPVTTGLRPNAVKLPTVTTNNKAALYGGFLVMSGYRLNPNGGDDYAFILDADGDAVWWYQPRGFGSLSVAKMSYDGKSIWIANDNVPKNAAHVGRLSMDGMTWEDKSSEFANLNHDLTVLPDETVIFIAYGPNDCDDIKERSPNGTVRTIVNSSKVFGTSAACHCNAIQYDPSDDTVVVSEDNHSGYFKTDRQGNIKWVLNGGTGINSFDKTGGGATGWIGNHNLHILGPDHLLFFNNGVSAYQAGTKPATARELKLDLTKLTTSEVWKYESSPTISNAVMGDVQRLENGNTVVAYSTAGTIHEVDADKNVLQTLVWSGLGAGGFGYITKRKTLYGRSPR